MSLAVCVVEFLFLLGIPLLRALHNLIQATITQLEILKAYLLTQTPIEEAMQSALLLAQGKFATITDEVRNILSSLPLGTIKECEEAAKAIEMIRSGFDEFFDYSDKVANEANRLASFADARSALIQKIDDDINYLRELDAQIDVVIIELLRREAESL